MTTYPGAQPPVPPPPVPPPAVPSPAGPPPASAAVPLPHATAPPADTGALLVGAATAVLVAHALRVLAAVSGLRLAAAVTDVAVGATTLLALGAAAAWAWTARTRVDTLVHRFRHRRRAVWAVLGWLVPLVQVWFPYQVVADVHHAATLRGAPRPRPPLERWWLCLLAGDAALAAAHVGARVADGWSWWLGGLAVAGLLALLRSLVDLATVVRALACIET